MVTATTEQASGVASRRASWPVRTAVVGVSLLGGLLGGYLLGSGGDPAAEPVAGSDAIVVVGATTCTRTSYETLSEADGVETIEEHFVCELEMSDARVSGTEELTVTSRVGDWTAGGIWTADGTITTPDGAWRGSGRGVFSAEMGELPGGDVYPPVNFGQMRYVGEGLYGDLTYEYHFVGTNSRDSRAGWIDDASSRR
jgi:hypothetical protein